MHAIGDLLDAVGTGVVRPRVPGQHVEHLEGARAQAVPVQDPVDLAQGARVHREDVAPLVHEHLLGLLRRHARTVAKKPLYCIRIKCICIGCMCM